MSASLPAPTNSTQALLEAAKNALSDLTRSQTCALENRTTLQERAADTLFSAILSAQSEAEKPEAVVEWVPGPDNNPLPPFHDPRVQAVYEVLNDDSWPSDVTHEHWEGQVARRIVSILASAQHREPEAVEAVAQDAKRYLWLRAAMNGDGRSELAGFTCLMESTAEEMDAAIDAAMAAAPLPEQS